MRFVIEFKSVTKLKLNRGLIRHKFELLYHFVNFTKCY